MSESEKENCSMYSAQMAIVNENTKQIADLYNKHEETLESYNELKLETVKLSAKVDYGFDQVNKSILQLCDTVKGFQTERAQTLKHYDGVVEDVYAKISDLSTKEKSIRWFTDKLTKLNNNFAFYAVIFILGIFLFLSAIQNGTFGKFKGLFGG